MSIINGNSSGFGVYNGWREQGNILRVEFRKDGIPSYLKARLHTAEFKHPQKHSSSSLRFLFVVLLAALVSLYGCDAVESVTGGSSEGETSGPAYSSPGVTLSPTNISGVGDGGYTIDTSTANSGYVSAAATSSTRLKFQITLGEMSYNYDLPNDGTPIVCPINMGDGSYMFSVWENTSGNRYVELGNAAADVALESEFVPYIRPSYFCTYTDSSAAVQKANELTADAQNQGDVVRGIYNWIVDNIGYDTDKALTVEDGYIPSPDATLSSGKGICFDYASLAAAMLRSQGIPCKIMTGYVSPDNIYHAWNLVYIDGTWKAVSIDIEANTWTRIDTTFAAGGASGYAGDGTTYTDRYTY